jgi:hypothetical protein
VSHDDKLGDSCRLSERVSPHIHSHRGAMALGIWELYARSVGSQPRKILWLVGWSVGDDPRDQFAASLTISCGLALVAVAIWIFCALICCESGQARRMRAQMKSQREKIPATTASLTATERLESLWTVHNKRYDLAPFVQSHPGGSAAILLGRGRNCTELFESYHSLSNERRVRKTLERYYVEDAPAGAPDYENHFDWGRSPFYDALKLRVRAYFTEQKHWNGHRAPFWQWFQLVGMIVVSLVVLLSFMQGSFFAMCLFPFCYWCEPKCPSLPKPHDRRSDDGTHCRWGPSPCMHDGGHFSLSRKPWLNQLMAHIGKRVLQLWPVDRVLRAWTRWRIPL